MLAFAAVAVGNEPFQPSPELVGLKKVALVLTFTINLNRAEVETAILERLASAGISIVQQGDQPTLRIDLDTSLFETPLCPGMVSLQVRIALDDPVVLKRNRAVIRATTWSDHTVAAIVAKGDVASLAAQDVLYLVDRFVENVAVNSEYASRKKR